MMASRSSPPETNSDACTAIVVNHNAGAILEQSIAALLHAEGVSSVRLIDNASTDDSLEQVHKAHAEALASGRLQLLKEDTNRGFAAACNRAAHGVGTPFLAFVNPDCVVQPDTIFRMLSALRSTPEAGLAGAWIMNPDGSEQRATRRRLPTFPRMLKTYLGLEKLALRYPAQLNALAGINLSHKPLPQAVASVEAVSGALMVVKRDAFEVVGGFDEGYPLHFEDLDLFARLQKSGKKILLVPEARATHYQGSCSHNQPLVQRLKWYGLRRYWRQHSRNPLLRALVRMIPAARLPSK